MTLASDRHPGSREAAGAPPLIARTRQATSSAHLTLLSPTDGWEGGELESGRAQDACLRRVGDTGASKVFVSGRSLRA